MLEWSFLQRQPLSYTAFSSPLLPFFFRLPTFKQHCCRLIFSLFPRIQDKKHAIFPVNSLYRCIASFKLRRSSDLLYSDYLLYYILIFSSLFIFKTNIIISHQHSILIWRKTVFVVKGFIFHFWLIKKATLVWFCGMRHKFNWIFSHLKRCLLNAPRLIGCLFSACNRELTARLADCTTSLSDVFPWKINCLVFGFFPVKFLTLF